MKSVIAVVSMGVAWSFAVAKQDEKPPAWAAFELSELREKQLQSKRSYLPFLNAETLHCGVYTLKKDSIDRQNPHKQDEVYYAVKGKARFEVGSGAESKDLEVRPGSVLFVAAGVEHRFHTITEDLELLVFFSKAKPSSKSTVQQR